MPRSARIGLVALGVIAALAGMAPVAAQEPSDGQRVEATREGPYLRMLPTRGAARLGVTVQELTPQLANYFRTKGGVLIASVRHHSPAGEAGLRAGDVITSVDGEPVRDGADLKEALDRDLKGERLLIGLTREGRTNRIEVAIPPATRAK